MPKRRWELMLVVCYVAVVQSVNDFFFCHFELPLKGLQFPFSFLVSTYHGVLVLLSGWNKFVRVLGRIILLAFSVMLWSFQSVNEFVLMQLHFLCGKYIVLKVISRKCSFSRCSRNTVARTAASQNPIRSGSKAGFQSSLNCPVS